MQDNQFTIAPAKHKDLGQVISDFITDIKHDDKFKSSFEYIMENEERIGRFIAEGKTHIEPLNQLIVLRKWNSYTPILPAREDYASKGGGYFLKFQDTGIVIDPGYNFIENFLKAGFKLDDIDHIFVSHAHNDHTVELEGIFSLLYKRNKDSENPKKIKLHMNLGSFKKFSGYFDLSNPTKEFYIDNIVMLNRHQLFKLNDDIEVFTTQAQHHEMITSKYAIGFTFIFNIGSDEKRVVKFTCDTGWNSEMEKQNQEQGEPFKIDKVDILVAHLGSMKEKELNYNVEKGLQENENVLYKDHLGLIGTVAAIHFWQPELTLISEFGEELNAIRHKISEKIGKFLNKKVSPVDINFRINLDDMNIMCFKTREFFEPEKIKVYYDEKTDLYFINEEQLTPTEKGELRGHLGKEIKVFQE